MKADLSKINQEYFYIRPVQIGEEECFLVYPKSIGAKWDKSNLIYRSSIWGKNGEPVSLGFKKFFNLGEQPDLSFQPFSLNANGGVDIVEKMDGSLLCCGIWKNNLIHRTRGNPDASSMNNGFEIPLLLQRYPKIVQYLKQNCDKDGTCPFSLIFEWVSPNNTIVINYPEANLFLIAKIRHEDYSLEPQKNLDILAQDLEVPRPRTFEFKTFEEMFVAINASDYLDNKKYNSSKDMLEVARANKSELAQNFEGFCLYCNRGKAIVKCKGLWYLAKHRMKSDLCNLEHVIDLWSTLDYPDYSTFYNYICTTIDYEVAERAKGDISKICDAKKQVDKIVSHMHKFVEDLKPLNLKYGFRDARKHQAKKIFESYGKDSNRASFVFSILDGREIDRNGIKKLLFQAMK